MFLIRVDNGAHIRLNDIFGSLCNIISMLEICYETNWSELKLSDKGIYLR